MAYPNQHGYYVQGTNSQPSSSYDPARAMRNSTLQSPNLTAQYDAPTTQHPPTYNGQTSYRNDAWRNGQNVPYNYTQQHDVFHAKPMTSERAHAYEGPRADAYSHNAYGLNRLAYASALEPSRSPVQPSQSSTHTQSLIQNRAGIASTTQTYATQPPQLQQGFTSRNMRQQRSGSSSSTQRMAIDAAAALAEAVRGRVQSPSEQYSAPQNRFNPVFDASTGNSQRKSNNVSQRLASPRVQERAVAPVQHRTDANPSPQTGYTPFADMPPVQSVPNQEPPRHDLQAGVVGRDNNANMAGATDRTQQKAAQSQGGNEQLPYYVDPRQVFSSHHQEYGRKRTETEETTNKQQAGHTRKAASTITNVESEPPTKPQDPAAANSKLKITKKIAGPEVANTESTPDKGTATSNQEQMAVELKTMMERMKLFRSKDPSLFQKLWNEMRGKESGVTAVQQATSIPALLSVPTEKGQDSEALPDSNAGSSKITPVKKHSQTTPGPPLNGYKIVVENNPEALPDLGRFPAGRRIRQSLKGKEQSAKSQSPLPPPVLPELSRPKSSASTSESKWPEHRRKAVAAAALRLLKTYDENKNSSVTTEDVCSILEKNPSYLELCAALEARGLKFQRTLFARELLRNVPDLNNNHEPGSDNSNASKLTNTVKRSAEAQSTPGPLPTEHANLAQQAFTQNSQATKPHRSSNFVEYQPQPGKRTSENMLGTKEAAARKRDFADIIDLTELADNDDYIMPETKKARLDPVVGTSSGQVPHIGMDPSSSAASTNLTNFSSIGTPATAPLRFNSQVVLTGQSSQLVPTIVTPQSGADQTPSRQMILAHKVNKAEAFQRTYYDPRTVARDILIASGKHPFERPLNSHLNALYPSHIDLDSDVSTFDWDAIDPGGPLLPKVEYAQVAAIPPRLAFGVRKSPPKPKQETVTKNAVPSRTGSPPASLASPSRLVRNADNKLPPKELDTSRSPKPQSTSLPAEPGPFTQSLSQTRKISINVPDLSTQRLRLSATPSSRPSAQKPKMDPVTSSAPRRGRPPGSKNKHPSVRSHQSRPTPPAIAFRETTGATAVAVASAAQEPETQSAPLPGYKCKWVKCRSELHNLDTLRKHVWARHRPTDESNREGEFICWWKNCKYLHRKDDGFVESKKIFADMKEWMAHVESDHLAPIAFKYGDGPNTNTGKPQVSKMELSRFIYIPPTRTRPSARSLSYTDPQAAVQARERFLADEHGRSTTPAISLDGSTHLPNDVLELTRYYPEGQRNEVSETNDKAQKAFLKAHGAKLGDHRRRAEETIRAMATRKMKAGPGVDRGGCTLINEARRATFIQAPGIARVIETPY